MLRILMGEANDMEKQMDKVSRGWENAKEMPKINTLQQKSIFAVIVQGPEDIKQDKYQNTYMQACQMKTAKNQTKRIIKN